MKPKTIMQQNRYYLKCIIIVFLVIGFGLLVSLTGNCYAKPDKAAFVSKIVYKTDGQGDYEFDEIKAPATYEFTTPHETDGIVYSITCSYTFTGKVTIELSTTGRAGDYIPVVNGVPLDLAGHNTGKAIIWRATLAEGSTLTEVVITYMDASGVVGSFGNPDLSGFLFRKPVYIKFPSPYPSPQGGEGIEAVSVSPQGGEGIKDLFHYQLPIKIGESSKSEGCDVCLKGVIQADFADCRFTLTDQETLIPHYLESITGESPNRAAKFYIKIPQLPEEGLLVYLYYGNSDAADLSSGEAVFDLFDDFEGPELDTEKWDVALDDELSYTEVFNSELRLDGARITSKGYGFSSGIIEFRAKSTAAAIEGIIGEYAGYSSSYPGAEHAIALGRSVKSNDPKAITSNKYYSYRIIKDDEDLTFQRYDEADNLEAEAQYAIGLTQSVNIGLYATADLLGSYFDYIRVRRYAASSPTVDIEKTQKALEEVPNIAEFNGVTIAPDGDLVLGEGIAEGEYISQLINSPFKARVIVPSWVGEGAAMDISAEEYAKYRESCVSGAYYYASKDDFTAGDKLRWRARFTGDERSPSLMQQNRYYLKCCIKEFRMDFRPGDIELVKPNGGEYLTGGVEYTIVWDAYDYEPSYKFKLYYSIDGGKTYNAIATVANKARYVWTVPSPYPSPQGGEGMGEGADKCLVKIADSLEPGIYDVSNAYFAIGLEAPEETVEEEEVEEEVVEETSEEIEELAEEEEEEPAQRPGTQLYELLIKVGDNAGYEEGDIVMVKPAGFIWGRDEKNSDKFAIVRAYLTEEEAAELMKPEMGDRYDGSGKLVRKVLRRRKHKVDLETAGVIKKNLFGMRRLLRSQPFVDLETIEAKPAKQPTFMERLRERIGTRGKVTIKEAQ